jgi:HEAT repeats/Outer membrane lipoprotein
MFKNTKTTSRVTIQFLAVLTLLVSLAGAALGQQRSSTSNSTNRSSQQSQSNTDATTVFRSARDLITDGEWAKAQEKFDEYVTSYPNEKNIEAALYWLAYAQQKLARYDQCRATIDRLLEKYPNSSWRDDARMLRIQAPVAYAMAAEDLAATLRATPAPLAPVDVPMAYTPVAPITTVNVTPLPAQVAEIASAYGVDSSSDSGADDDPCEFKIVVLQALFQTDLQRGIMAATEWLKPGSTQTTRCKSAALTLLGRNGGKAVTPVILGVARSEPDLKLRARAISTLGATNDDTVVDALREFALNSPENDIVEASLYALSKHSGERAINVLADIAISGKTTSQRKMAISSIASRPGEPSVDALFRIYDADQTVEIRRSVINGFGNRKSERAGTKLLEIARSSDNVDLRKAAVSSISRRGGDKVVEFLLAIYNTEKNEEVKDQILSSLGSGQMFYTTSNKGPVAITPGQTTARMSDERVINKFIEIARNQQEPMERRKRAIGWLSRSKDPKVLAFLQELLK